MIITNRAHQLGGIAFIGFFLFSGEEITAIFLLFRTLFALGLIGLGFSLGLEKPAQSGLGKKVVVYDTNATTHYH